MKKEETRLMCNTLHQSNGVLTFKQVNRSISVSDLVMISDFHKALLDVLIDNKLLDNELKRYQVSLTKVNHMRWQIDIYNEYGWIDDIIFKTEKGINGIPVWVKSDLSAILFNLLMQ